MNDDVFFNWRFFYIFLNNFNNFNIFFNNVFFFFNNWRWFLVWSDSYYLNSTESDGQILNKGKCLISNDIDYLKSRGRDCLTWNEDDCLILWGKRYNEWIKINLEIDFRKNKKKKLFITFNVNNLIWFDNLMWTMIVNE